MAYGPDIIEPDTELGHLRWENARLRAMLSDAQWALAIFLHAWEGDHRPPAKAIAIAQGAKRNLDQQQESTASQREP